MNPNSLFGLSDHLALLSKHGDPLEVLDATVDFEDFRDCESRRQIGPQKRSDFLIVAD